MLRWQARKRARNSLCVAAAPIRPGIDRPTRRRRRGREASPTGRRTPRTCVQERGADRALGRPAACKAEASSKSTPLRAAAGDVCGRERAVQRQRDKERAREPGSERERERERGLGGMCVLLGHGARATRCKTGLAGPDGPDGLEVSGRSCRMRNIRVWVRPRPSPRRRPAAGRRRPVSHVTARRTPTETRRQAACLLDSALGRCPTRSGRGPERVGGHRPVGKGGAAGLGCPSHESGPIQVSSYSGTRIARRPGVVAAAAGRTVSPADFQASISFFRRFLSQPEAPPHRPPPTL